MDLLSFKADYGSLIGTIQTCKMQVNKSEWLPIVFEDSSLLMTLEQVNFDIFFLLMYLEAAWFSCGFVL
jgi:hypothetical protein